MTHPLGGFGLAAILAFVSTISAAPTFAQVTVAPTASSTAAYVYIQIQGPEGAVYGFRASSTGHLSAIPGSPFKPAGQIVGSTPTKFFTLGKTLIHSYGISSDGAIESQLSQIPFIDYDNQCSGSQQSASGGAVLDHTGKYVYVLFGCDAGNEYQTYLIHADGAFSYDGDTDLPQCYCGFGLPSILGNESFAYAEDSSGHQSSTIGLRRESSGALQVVSQFAETDPSLANGYYVPRSPDASPSGNYVVIQLYPDDGTPVQLASYTVDSGGNISSTNTSSNMPTSAFPELNSMFSPSGDLFVAYEDGIEIYKFNGAAPLTLWQTALTGTPIYQVAWDGSNHMYAIGDTNKLYVFTVTSTSVTLTSSINIGSPYKMVVVSE
jgi:hypothetical protein